MAELLCWYFMLDDCFPPRSSWYFHTIIVYCYPGTILLITTGSTSAWCRDWPKCTGLLSSFSCCVQACCTWERNVKAALYISQSRSQTLRSPWPAIWERDCILAETILKNTLQMSMRTYVARVWPFNKCVIQAFTVAQRIIGFPTGVVVLLMRFLLWVFWVRLCKH